MVWKQRIFWILVSMIAAYLASSLASRRFRSEVSAIRGEVDKQTELMQQALITIRNGINAHG